MSKERITIIIPAAGYGTRVGSPQSKELLIDENTGRPLIDRALGIQDLINRNHNRNHNHEVIIHTHVITRAEKKDLIEYVETRGVQAQIITPSKEWPDTVLQSANFWTDKNLLILPDTIWEPNEIILGMLDSLDHVDVAVATFDTQDLQSFGAFVNVNGEVWHAEKPANSNFKDDNYDANYDAAKAWGLIAFRREAGAQLFAQMLKSTFDHEWRKLAASVQFCELESFIDLTRG